MWQDSFYFHSMYIFITPFENVRTAFIAFCNENITWFHVKNDMYLTKPNSGFAVLKTQIWFHVT